MKKLKINKRTVTVAAYTIAILSAISFAIYPGTNAIFKKDNNEALAYETNLKDVYKNSIINPDNKKLIDLVDFENEKTTPTNAIFGIPFIIDAENNGIYRISMENSNSVCTIADATPKNLILKEIENSNPKDYYLTPINNTVTSGTVYMSCPVDINDTNYKIKLYEHVENEVGEEVEVEDEFLYASTELKLDYNGYQSQFNDLYDEFWEQLVAYLNLDKNKAILEEFEMFTIEDFDKKINYSIFKEFLKYYSSDKEADNYNPAILNGVIEGNSSIPGISGSKETTENGDKYTFNFDDSLIGLVKTYIFYNKPNTIRPHSEYVYFSTDIVSTTTLEKTIEYMFKTNGNNEETDSKEQENINLLFEYIKAYTKKNDSFTISDIKSVIGTAPSKSDHQIFYYLNILDNAYNYLYGKEYNKLRISYFRTAIETEDYGYETFKNGLDFTYGSESALTKSLKASIYSLNIYPSISSFDKEYPAYYEIHTDDYGNLKLVKVEVSKEDNCKYVYITDLNDLEENDVIGNYIKKYLKDLNVTNPTLNDLEQIPGLTLTNAKYPTNSDNIYSFITFNDNFMDYANNYKGSDIIKIGFNSNTDTMVTDIITKTEDIKDDNNINKYNSSVINSLQASLTNPALRSVLESSKEIEYYDIHYDSENNELLLFKYNKLANKDVNVSILNLTDTYTIELFREEIKTKGILSLYYYEDIENPVATDYLINSLKDVFPNYITSLNTDVFYTNEDGTKLYNIGSYEVSKSNQ